MSNASAESPKTAIRRMMSTVETIQSLFPDLWVDADDGDPREAASKIGVERRGLEGTWNRVQQSCGAPVPAKGSGQPDVSWPDARTKPVSSDGAMSRLMSTVATNRLLFPDLWDPIDGVQELTDGFRAARGFDSIWSDNQPQQQHLRLPVKRQNTPNSLSRLSRRENVDRSEDEDSSDSGIYSGTYLA